MIDSKITRLDSCQLCPRRCGVDRDQGVRGFCHETSKIRAARAALHFWEEPCISGTAGSGAVFFSGCTLRCVFCQNHDIAESQVGKAISRERLAEIFLELQDEGANNINLVTAGHQLPSVIWAMQKAKDQGLTIPIVYNTSSYESLASIQALEGLVDIYLPDFKYVSTDLSERYSHAKDYFKTASAAVGEMVRQTGSPRFFRKGQADKLYGADWYNDHCDEEGEILIRRGTIVRHLLLPGCSQDSIKVIDYLYKTYGDQIYISIMNQYTPLRTVQSMPELNRKVTEEEYDKVIDHAISLGIENAFIQEGDVAKESFIPDFSYEGL